MIMTVSRPIAVIAALLACLLLVVPARAEVTPEQTRELRELKSEVTKVAGLLRKKEYDAARTLLDEAQAKLQEIMQAAEVDQNDRRLQGVPQLIATRRKALELQMSKAGGAAAPGGVSFVDDVAPIIADNCLGCHGMNNPRANLRLDTFAGWKRGGQNGQLLTAGAPNRSLILARLLAPNPNQRMPRGQEPLEREEITTIANWINEGAKFDGDAETTLLGQLRKAAEMKDIVIPKPKGTETVSFTKDIAPMMVRLCIRCHSGNNPSSGLSLVSFQDMMIGGDSGEVIIPGDRENSRLFRLVGGLENPRMPQGQARITRQNYEDLIKWFDEGNVFDGTDPKAPLASYVPTEEDLAEQRFAAMSADEFIAHRRQRTEEIWKRTLPNDPHQILETDELLIVGDVPEERLKQVEGWASAHLEKLRRTFDAGSDPLWKGKLAIFVFKERFGLTEYATSIANLRAPDGMFGDSVVTRTHSDAYVVVQDVGDEPSATQPGLKANLIDHLTGAFVQRKAPLPKWITRGTGLLMVAQDQPASPYIKQLPRQAAAAVSGVDRPQDVFAEGTFSPAVVGAVGYALVDYLVSASGNARFSQLVQQLQSGAELEAAVRTAYGSSLDDVGRSFLTALRRSAR
jgi:mono/diheme cytochrome c family protein